MDGVFDDGEFGEGDNVGADIENALGGTGDDTLIGSASANNLVGAAGADTIDGAAGDDTITGGSGGDRLTGGAGSDTVSAGDGQRHGRRRCRERRSRRRGRRRHARLLRSHGGDHGDPVVVLTPEHRRGRDRHASSPSRTSPAAPAADTLGGDGNANVISGNAGNDTIIGDGGDDTISGDLGVDTVDYSSLAGCRHRRPGARNRCDAGREHGRGAATDSLLGIENVSGGAGARLPHRRAGCERAQRKRRKRHPCGPGGQ